MDERGQERPSGGPEALNTFDELLRVLQSDWGRLTPSQQRVADLVLGNPEDCALMTVTELARNAGVNESTVVRFATSLGLSGYPALSRLCREHLRAQAQLLSRFRAVECLTRDWSDPLTRAVTFDRANLERTFARITEADWQRATDTLATAPRVHVIGLRKCYGVAYVLAYLLGLVRGEVWQLSLGPGTLTDQLRRVEAGDAFVAISIRRYARDTVRALTYARRRGAATVVLTDTAASPLAPLADVCFYVDTAGVSILRSLTAFVSLAQALATATATCLGSDTRSSLLLDEELLDEFHVYNKDGERDEG